MKRSFWSYGASLLIHAAVLFGGAWWLYREAEYEVEAGPSTVEVNLVEKAPEPPAPKPEPTPLLTPPPTPLPTPPPVGDVPVEKAPTPTPEPTPTSTPTPKPSATPVATPRETPRPRPSATPRRTATAAGPAKSATRSSGAQGNSPPQYLHNPAPEYPPSAKAVRRQGTVMLQVEIDAKGRPASVQVSRSSGSGDLDAAAVRAVRRWRFKPATLAGTAVSTRIQVPVVFQLSGG